MKKSDIDDKILDLIKKDENISNSELAAKLGIPQEEVEREFL